MAPRLACIYLRAFRHGTDGITEATVSPRRTHSRKFPEAAVSAQVPERPLPRCPLSGHHNDDTGFSIVPILTRPVTRRSALKRTGGVFAGTLAALGTLSMLEDLSRVPIRVAAADEISTFPDVQFNLSPFMPPAQTIDGIKIGMPPVHTTFVTARLGGTPSRADQNRMENAIQAIEDTYSYA